jgi:hypothetical protein
MARHSRFLAVSLCVALLAGGAAGAAEAEHREFDATLHAPYRGDPAASQQFGAHRPAESRTPA